MAHFLDLNLFKHRIINLKQWQQRSQVSLDSLTLVALLTINSFPITIPHKISRSLNVFSYLIVINHFSFFFILGEMKWREGNLFVIYDNES